MSGTPTYWFPAKGYGWGWGPPVCWQGWVVFLGYLALIVGGLRYFAAARPTVSGALVYFTVLTIIFVVIVAIKGERGR